MTLAAAVAVFGTVNAADAVTAGGAAVANTAPDAAGSVTRVRAAPVRSRAPARQRDGAGRRAAAR